MLLEEVRYCRPETLEDAIGMLRSHGRARVLAGGQSLLNVMKHRIASPEVLVDLGGIPNLSYVATEDNGATRIGAMTTYDELDNSDDLRRAHPIVAEVAGGLVDQQVRNRGTIGGNLCYSDPTSNLPPLMVVLDATMIVMGPDGERQVPAADFFQGAYNPDLGAGELLSAIRLPVRRSGAGHGYVSLRVSAHGWGIVHAAAAVVLEDGAVADARVALGCVADRPVRASAMEDALRGESPTWEALRDAAEGVGDGLDPVSDAHASGSHRRRMAKVMARRAVVQAVERARS